MSQRSLYELWLRLHDQPLEVIGLHALATAYAFDAGTDGPVLRGFLRGAGASDDIISAAVARGLLSEDRDGQLAVADFLTHHESAAKRAARREKDRGKKQRRRRAVPAGQLDVDDAQLREVVDGATCPLGTKPRVPWGQTDSSPGDGCVSLPYTRVRARASAFGCC